MSVSLRIFQCLTLTVSGWQGLSVLQEATQKYKSVVSTAVSDCQWLSSML